MSASECRYYHLPKSLDEALALFAGAEVPIHPVAGGTDLLVRDRRGMMPPGPWEMVSLRRIPELTGIVEEDGKLRIGAAVTALELAASGPVREKLPVLARNADRIASPQIRAVATVGGNLANASPAADLSLPLLLLQGEAELVRRNDEGSHSRRRVSLDDFFTGPGGTVLEPAELIAAVLVPIPREGTRLAVEKAGTRPAMECAVASAGLAVKMGPVSGKVGTVTPFQQPETVASADVGKVGTVTTFHEEVGTVTGARIVFGALAPVVLRGRATEKALIGRPLDDETMELAAAAARDEVSPITDVRGSEVYRRELAASLTRRLIRACRD